MSRYDSHQWMGSDDDDRCAVCFVTWIDCDDYCRHERIGGDCVDCGVKWPCPTEVRRRDAGPTP